MAHDISQITGYLFISSWPKEHHVEEILSLNVRLILSMHWIRPDQALNHPPLRVLHLPTIDTPLTPMPIFQLRRGVKAALPVIRDDRAVLVHCKAGVHRSVAMACCVLIAMDYTADEAMRIVAEKRPVADPYVWYIARRIRRFEATWKADSPV
ncbi:MAG: dual specificity protein phosphatase family protein [Anaerolineae bacterium]|nr:dual specificity protein phosphatase family protein [Anaerolineae bacterium]